MFLHRRLEVINGKNYLKKIICFTSFRIENLNYVQLDISFFNMTFR